MMKKTLLFTGVILSTIVFSQNTQIRNNAGAPTTLSGFYETETPINYPEGAASWWHLLDVRHSNPNNNFGMQFSGSFYDQELYFRKVTNNSSQPWRKAILEAAPGKIKIGINDVTASDANLRIFQTENAYVELANSHGRFMIAKSSCNGCFASDAIPGDAVIRNMGVSHNILFSMPNNNNDGNSYIGINDGTNNTWIKFFNNATAKFNGKIFAKEVEVKTNVWADYVFKKDYQLKTLEEVEKHISKKGHLPNIPSASEVIEKGINVAEMDAKLLEKIEELTLYSIEQNKQLKSQSEEIKELKNQVQQLILNHK